MKTTKTQAVLLMYRMLEEKGYLKKEEVMRQLELSNLAFSRYISELNGDNRDNYKQLLLKLSVTLSKLIALQFPE